jgi:hypothetical protein
MHHSSPARPLFSGHIEHVRELPMDEWSVLSRFPTRDRLDKKKNLYCPPNSDLNSPIYGQKVCPTAFPCFEPLYHGNYKCHKQVIIDPDAVRRGKATVHEAIVLQKQTMAISSSKCPPGSILSASHCDNPKRPLFVCYNAKDKTCHTQVGTRGTMGTRAIPVTEMQQQQQQTRGGDYALYNRPAQEPSELTKKMKWIYSLYGEPAVESMLAQRSLYEPLFEKKGRSSSSKSSDKQGSHLDGDVLFWLGKLALKNEDERIKEIVQFENFYKLIAPNDRARIRRQVIQASSQRHIAEVCRIALHVMNAFDEKKGIKDKGPRGDAVYWQARLSNDLARKDQEKEKIETIVAFDEYYRSLTPQRQQQLKTELSHGPEDV